MNELQKISFLTIVLIIYPKFQFGTTYKPAYPFTQQIEGQLVTIHSEPYAPFDGSAMIGKTTIYYNSQEIYSIDKYFRSTLVPSDNGELLAIIDFYISGIFPWEDRFNPVVITILKRGKLYKEYRLKDVLDVNKLQSVDFGKFWGYYSLTDFSIKDAKDECKICREVYGRETLNNCPNDEIYDEDCFDCRKSCELVKNKKLEKKLMQGSVFMKDNTLSILNSGNEIIQIEMEKGDLINRVGIQELIPRISRFNPPRIKRKYKKIKYPSKFLLPRLGSGETIQKLINKNFSKDLKSYEKSFGENSIYIHSIVINKSGQCENLYISVEDLDLKAKLESWMLSQKFDTKNIPNRFFKYKFTGFLDIATIN